MEEIFENRRVPPVLFTLNNSVDLSRISEECTQQAMVHEQVGEGSSEWNVLYNPLSWNNDTQTIFVGAMGLSVASLSSELCQINPQLCS